MLVNYLEFEFLKLDLTFKNTDCWMYNILNQSKIFEF